MPSCMAFTHEFAQHKTCIYMTPDLAGEDSYIIHEDDYYIDKTTNHNIVRLLTA